jgi:hypothetical protein
VHRLMLGGLLGCPRLVLPGNHTVFKNMPESFAKALLDRFSKLRERKYSVRMANSII